MLYNLVERKLNEQAQALAASSVSSVALWSQFPPEGYRGCGEAL